MYEPYVYLIGWKELDKWYIGSEYGRKSKVANPKNLWTNYFTSSKIVEEYRKIYGEPDVIEIRKTFRTAEETIEYEYKLLQRLNVVRTSKWLNQCDSKGLLLDDITIKRTAKICSEKLKGRKLGPYSEERKQAMRVPKSRHTPLSQEIYDLRGKKSGETRKGKPNGRKGIFKHSDETRKKMSESRKGVTKPPRSEKHKKSIAERSSKLYEITFPDGRKEVIKNLSEFCRNEGFSGSSLLRLVSRGIRNDYQGYKAKLIS